MTDLEFKVAAKSRVAARASRQLNSYSIYVYLALVEIRKRWGGYTSSSRERDRERENTFVRLHLDTVVQL